MSTLLKIARFERLKLTFYIEASLELLHVRIFSFPIDASHFNEVSAFVVKIGHHILECVLAEFVEDWY